MTQDAKGYRKAEIMRQLDEKYQVSETARVILMDVMTRYLADQLALDICNEFSWEIQKRKVDEGMEILSRPDGCTLVVAGVDLTRHPEA